MNELNDLPSGLSFGLTLEQEDQLSKWLDEQNQVIVEEQLKSEEFTEIQKEIQQKSLDTGTPIPIYDMNAGYFTISFTPTGWGNRIYVHNHFTGKSFKLFDYEDFQKQLGEATNETEKV
ncbi:MAG: hypothetical protein CMM25_09240 [Rhodospirillaceae bacterium]|jgi:hypothetical protein|nr:hypothetical protein [Rhodospirillaceae bacterium]